MNEWKYTFTPPLHPIRLNAIHRDKFALPSANNKMNVDFTTPHVGELSRRSVCYVGLYEGRTESHEQQFFVK